MMLEMDFLDRHWRKLLEGDDACEQEMKARRSKMRDRMVEGFMFVWLFVCGN